MIRALAITVFFATCCFAEKLVLVTISGEPPLNGPFGVDFHPSGLIYIIEMNGNRLRTLSENNTLGTIAGTGHKGSAHGQLNGPHAIAVDGKGDIYIGDTWNNRVLRVNGLTGAISTIAGTGKKGFTGDGGPATKADFGGIYCVALDESDKNLFVADLDNRRIRRINLDSGVVTTVAGNGQKGVPADGAIATNAPLVDPRAVAVDDVGLIYVLERSGHALRVVDSMGRIKTVVGTGEKGFIGDDGEARAAKLNGPKHLWVDSRGDVLIADTENHVIRKYLPREGKVIRIAGTGKKGALGLNGPPLEADLSQPHGVITDKHGIIFIADSSNNRVVKVVP